MLQKKYSTKKSCLFNYNISLLFRNKAVYNEILVLQTCTAVGCTHCNIVWKMYYFYCMYSIKTKTLPMLGTGFFLKIAKIDCQQEKPIYPNPAFQLILSSGGLCRSSERTPRDHMLILFIIFKLTLICNLSGHEALFVGPLTCLLSGKLLIAKISARKTQKIANLQK